MPEGARFCPNCGTAAASEDGLPRVGSLIEGRYRIQAKLGEGGFSSVFLARHERLGRDVALKILRPELVAAPSVVARFAREARAAARIAHPNVIEVLDFGRTDAGHYYLALEFVPGVSLEQELKQRGVIPLARATHVLAQIAVALETAHGHGIVHRDIKPGNVMLTHRGSEPDFVKVLDFGIARTALDSDGSLTLPGQMLGTPLYMAPELWNGEVATPQTDMYAFGVLAHELLTGTPPFMAPSIPALLVAHVQASAPLPSGRVALGEAGPRVDAFVLRCLAKKPGQRFASMGELRGALLALSPTDAGLRRRTYARAAPRPAEESGLTVLDAGATAFESRSFDAEWDGPGLAMELGHLYSLRERRYATLAQKLWPGGIEPTVRALVQELGMRTAVLRGAVSRVVEISDEMNRSEAGWDRRHASVRSQMVDASVAAFVEDERLPVGASEELEAVRLDDFGEELTNREVELDDTRPFVRSESALRELERRLEALERERVAGRLEQRRALESALAQVVSAHKGATPKSSEVWQVLTKAARLVRDARPALVEYGKIDGAIASLSGMLEAALVG